MLVITALLVTGLHKLWVLGNAKWSSTYTALDNQQQSLGHCFNALNTLWTEYNQKLQNRVLSIQGKVQATLLMPQDIQKCAHVKFTKLKEILTFALLL
jgi:hypothetical protein